MSRHTLMTIGHSTLPIEVFVRALTENGCDMLVDVRRFPGSRRNPQYGQERLFASLAEAGIRSAWREGMGGRRAPRPDSENTGWRNESFRGYADYMQTPKFAAEMAWLIEQLEHHTAAVMCAEALPWRCHRSLIADAIVAQGMAAEDIMVMAEGKSSRQTHRLPEFARVIGGRLTYPGVRDATPDLFGGVNSQ